MRSLVLILASLVALSGCYRKTDPPGEAPTGVAATTGDGLVVVTWDVLPDLDYWIFYQPGSSVDVATPNSIAIRRAITPRVVAGLANGTQYAFVMNATHADSAAGPTSFPVVATPRLAGASWVSGTPLGTAPANPNLNDLLLNGSTFVTVGDAATIFSGGFNYTAGEFNFVFGDPQGVTQWSPPTTLPAGYSADLKSVTLAAGAYVALGADGSVISSADAVNWGSNGRVSIASVPVTDLSSIGFAFVSGSPLYLVVGTGGRIYNTPDLANWTQVGVGVTGSDLTLITLLNGRFLITGTGGTLLTSPDGSTWSPLTTNTANTLRGVTFCGFCTGVHYVAVGDAGTVITSPDGVAWTPVAPAPVADNLRSITVGGSAGTRLLAVGENGAVAYSDDGVTWSAASSGASNLSKVLYTGGLYLGVGDAGANAVSR